MEVSERRGDFDLATVVVPFLMGNVIKSVGCVAKKVGLINDMIIICAKLAASFC